MKKIIKIGERDIGMVSDGATPIFYWNIFHIDLFGIFANGNVKAEDNIHNIQAAAFVMAMQDQKTNAEMKKLTMDDYIEWSKAFEMMEISEIIVPAAVELWVASQETTVHPK